MLFRSRKMKKWLFFIILTTVILTFSLSLATICYSPTLRVELTVFEATGGHVWRSKIRDNFMPGAIARFYRFPEKCREAISRNSEIYENGRKIGEITPDVEKLRNRGSGLFRISRGMVEVTTSDNSDPNKNARVYFLKTGLLARSGVWITMFCSLFFLAFCYAFTALPSQLRALRERYRHEAAPQIRSELFIDPMNPHDRRHQILMWLLTAASLLLLLPYFDKVFFLGGKYMFYEDPTIYVNHTIWRGISALWTPHAGYLVVYPRIIAYLANFFPLGYRPDLYFLGYIVMYLTMVWCIVRCGASFGMNFVTVCFLALLIVYQPHSGMALTFSNTYTIWLAGAAYTIYMLSLNSENGERWPKAVEIPLLVLFGLTGVYSIPLVPVVAIKAFIFKDAGKFKYQYGTLLVCAVIQLYFILFATERGGKGIFEGNNPFSYDLFGMVLSYLTFGANKGYQYLLVVIFWSVFVVTLLIPLRYARFRTRAWIVALLSLVLMAEYMGLRIYYHLQTAPPGARLFDPLDRFGWMVYAPLFFGVVLAAQNIPKLKMPLLAAAAIVCFVCHPPFVHPFVERHLDAYRFNSFVNFSYYKPIRMIVRTRSNGEEWWINASSGQIRACDGVLQEYEIPGEFTIKPGKTVTRTIQWDLQADPDVQNHKLLFINTPIAGENATDIGIEIEMIRERGGFLRLFWGGKNNFNEDYSILRHYPKEGKIKAQFAFPNDRENIYLLIDPFMDPDKVKIEKITVYCLPK